MRRSDKIMGLGRYVMPEVKSIKEQAAERGVPMPFGKTADELLSSGYLIGHDVIGCALVMEDQESPTGAVWRMTAEDLDRVVLDGKYAGEVGERFVMRYHTKDDGSVLETPVCEPVVTARWLRAKKIPHVSKWLPNWAVVDYFHTMTDKETSVRYLDGVSFLPIPSMAPDAGEFEEEDERRGAAGLPPLMTFQRPVPMVTSWVGSSAGESIATCNAGEASWGGASADDPQPQHEDDTEAPDQPVHPEATGFGVFATTESFEKAQDNMPPDDGEDE